MTRTVFLAAGLALSLASVPGNANAQEVGCHDCEEFSAMCLKWGYHYHFQGAYNW